MWVKVKNGEVPIGAVVSGYEDNRQLQVFIARTNYKGGTHPCKKVSGRDHAHVSYGDYEYTTKEYEVYTGTGKCLV